MDARVKINNLYYVYRNTPMKLFELLTEGYKEVTQKFAQEADPEQVEQAVATFKDLVQRNQVTGNEKNIDWWGKQGWEKFASFVQAKSQQKSSTQIKRKKEAGNGIVIEETPDWLVVVPLDRFSSCFHGKNTDWCTAKVNQTHFEEYFVNDNVTLIYFINRYSEKWAMAVYNDPTELHGGDTAEFFDAADDVIERDDFETETDLDSEKYETIVRTSMKKEIDTGRQALVSIRDTLEEKIDEFTNRSPTRSVERNLEIEAMLQQYPDRALIKEYMEGLYYINGNRQIRANSDLPIFVATFSEKALKYFYSVPFKAAKIVLDNHKVSLENIPNPTQEIIEYALTVDLKNIAQVGFKWINIPFLQKASEIVMLSDQVIKNHHPYMIGGYWLNMLTYRVGGISESFLEWFADTFGKNGATSVLSYWNNAMRTDISKKFIFSNELFSKIAQKYERENDQYMNHLIKSIREKL